jgi:hypothetical protein
MSPNTPPVSLNVFGNTAAAIGPLGYCSYLQAPRGRSCPTLQDRSWDYQISKGQFSRQQVHQPPPDPDQHGRDLLCSEQLIF